MKSEKDVGCPRNGGPGSCELFYLGVGNQLWVPRKGSTEPPSKLQENFDSGSCSCE